VRACDDARLKIERAQKHSSDLIQIIDSIPQNYTISVKPIPGEIGTAICYELPQFESIRNSIALIAGDAIHNVRTALDYVWCDAIGTPSKFSKFPVHPNLDQLEASLKGTGLHTANARLFRLMIDEIRPFTDGGNALYLLHQLDIKDKHRLLLPVSKFGSIKEIKVSDRNGAVEGTSWGFEWSAYYHIDLEPGIQVLDPGKPDFELYFAEDSEGGRYEIKETIDSFIRVVADTVRKIEAC
jgi:hypothetical protein